MCLRISSALLLGLGIAGCSGETETVIAVAEDEAIACAIGPGAEFAPVCALEWEAAQDGAAKRAFLIVHPDGGFRRLELEPVTAELSVRDGAGELVDLPSAVDGIFEFSIDGDRYRVPLAKLLEDSP